MNTNRAILSGVVDNVAFSHTFQGKEFYRFDILSSIAQHNKPLPVIVADEIMDETIVLGQSVLISGVVRTKMVNEGQKKLFVYCHADNFTPVSHKCKHLNAVFLEGHVCRKPSYFEYENGGSIADTVIAVNRKHRVADYIPVYAYNDDALALKDVSVGQKIYINGYLRCRTFLQNTSDGKIEQSSCEIVAQKVF